MSPGEEGEKKGKKEDGGGSQREPTPQTSTDTEEPDLSLPSVLSDLKPPQDFESDMAARLARLSNTATDQMGLPSVPQFNPDTRPPPKKSTYGYTDQDKEAWCIVCLSDATVRCVGCEGDVYCARCWKEMHVGPRAGYDERGHRRERFDGRRV